MLLIIKSHHISKLLLSSRQNTLSTSPSVYLMFINITHSSFLPSLLIPARVALLLILPPIQKHPPCGVMLTKTQLVRVLHVGRPLHIYLCLSPGWAAELWTRWLQHSLGLCHCAPHNWCLYVNVLLIMQKGLFLCIAGWSY